MALLLEARNLRKVYTKSTGLFSPRSENVALDNFSMALDDETPVFIAIAGESGSGKTTLAQMLLGFTKPSSGEILYRGQNIHKLDSQGKKDYRKDVQAVFQDPFAVYNPFYPVDHILESPIRRFNLAESPEQSRKMILEALDAVGLRPEDTLGRYPHQLSGGQRQRITVARILLLRPKLVIADEPVSMVDASLRATILESMYKVHKDFGISFLYITHDLTTAYQVSDSIVILYRGVVAEAGAVEPVIKDPQHPYTQELISSIPLPNPGSLWMDEDGGIEAVETVTQTLAGCKYTSRCPHVMDKCRDVMPPLYNLSSGQAATCYLHDQAPILPPEQLTNLLYPKPEVNKLGK